MRLTVTVEEPSDKARVLADQIVRAFEFRQFHDLIGELDQASNEPVLFQNLLINLHDWKVLESRAVLEIVSGRLAIIDKFERMLVSDAPETAPRVGMDNLHDLLADHPWLLNPKYQVLAEEKAVTTQLREWGKEDIESEYRGRFDFLALSDEQMLVVIEIKSARHPLEFDELERLLQYRYRLQKGRSGTVHALLIWSGGINFPEQEYQSKESDERLKMMKWSDVFQGARRHYEHHRAVLQADVGHPDFARKKEEVHRTREVLESGTVYRGPKRRAQGLGPQDVDYETEPHKSKE